MSKEAFVEKLPTKAAFVRSLPVDTPAAEVIEKAQDIGLPMTPGDVHTNQWYMRQNATRAAGDSLPGMVLIKGKSKQKSVPPAPHSIPAIAQPKPSEKLAPPAKQKRQAKQLPAKQLPAKRRRGRRSNWTKQIPPDNEHQLRVLITRIGTKRARAVIAAIEGDLQTIQNG